ncbi:hypothetical protein [Micromonospora sp. NPDC048898]
MSSPSSEPEVLTAFAAVPRGRRASFHRSFDDGHAPRHDPHRPGGHEGHR